MFEPIIGIKRHEGCESFYFPPLFWSLCSLLFYHCSTECVYYVEPTLQLSIHCSFVGSFFFFQKGLIFSSWIYLPPIKNFCPTWNHLGGRSALKLGPFTERKRLGRMELKRRSTEGKTTFITLGGPRTPLWHWQQKVYAPTFSFFQRIVSYLILKWSAPEFYLMYRNYTRQL